MTASDSLCRSCASISWSFATAKDSDNFEIHGLCLNHPVEEDQTIQERLAALNTCSLCRLICRFLSEAGALQGDILHRKILLSCVTDFKASGIPTIGCFAGADGIRVGIDGVDQGALEERFPYLTQYLPLVTLPGT
jgi:hypothetical protein